MADDESSGGTESGLSKGVDRLRETTKWLITAFAGIGATLVAGSQLSSIGSLVPDHKGRFIIGLLGVLVAIAGVAWAIAAALNVLTSGSVSLDGLASRSPNDSVKKRLEEDTALMAGHSSLSALASAYSTAMTRRTTMYNEYLADPDDERKLGLAQRADANVQFMGQTVQNVLEVARFEDVARAFRNARWQLLVAAVAAAVGVTTFAAAANPPKTELHATRPGITVTLDSPVKTLSASFEGVGLAHNDELRVWVSREPGRVTLFRGLFGPDASGKVKRSVKLPVSERKRRSYMVLRVWSGDAVPPVCTVTATWEAWDQRSEASCVAVTIPAKAAGSAVRKKKS